MTSTIEAPSTRKAPAGPEKYLHYIAIADADRAVFEGLPVTALCGYSWTNYRPTEWAESEGRRVAWAERMPVCPECQQIYSQCPRASA